MVSNAFRGNTKIVIIGIGNKYRSDDGAGVITANRLKEAYANDMLILEQDGEPTELMDSWKEVDKVILIDAMSSDTSPGTVTRFNAREKPLPSKFFHYSTHTFNIAEVIELARVLDKLPGEIIVYGIEGKNFTNGERLSPEVHHAIEKTVELIKQELRT